MDQTSTSVSVPVTSRSVAPTTLVLDPPSTIASVPVTASSLDREKRIPLSAINLPPKMKLKGRPKGAEKTVVGLPQKKKKASNKPTVFHKKLPQTKDKFVLQWFVSECAAEKTITSGELLTKKDVKRAQFVSQACRDENVSVMRIRRFFTEDGWNAVLSVQKAVIKMGWICNICHKDLDDRQLGCDSCLEWSHLSCIGLKNPPKTAKWFCTKCYSNL